MRKNNRSRWETWPLIAAAFLAAEPFASAQNFHNQLHTFFGSPNITKHAAQMGYDYTPQGDSHAYGLKRISLLNARTSWLTYRDGSYIPGTSSISNAEYDQYVCIRNTGTSDPAQRYFVTWAMNRGGGVGLSLHLNFRSQAAITAAINYLNSSLDWSNIDAGFIDQTDTNLNYFTSSGDESLFSSWTGGGAQIECTNPNPNYTSAQGFLIYRKALRDLFRNRGLYTSANPWQIGTYGQELEQNAQFDHYYNESGIGNDSSSFGIVSPDKVTLEVAWPPSSPPWGTDAGKDFNKVFDVAGTAGHQGSWFGSYGEDYNWVVDPDGKPATGMNAIQLLRAMPNWDNLIGVPIPNRSWNGSVYSSPNSYADANIVYSRHAKNHKLFVVFRSNGSVAHILNGETVIDVQCADNLFIESGNCASQLSVSGTDVRLSGSGGLNRGYIVTLSGSGTPPPPPPPTNYTCPGGILCDGSTVAGTPNQLVCGQDFKNWTCTSSGWTTAGVACACGAPPPPPPPPPPAALPDVIVTALSYAGGQFTATVKNQGAAATPSGIAIGVGYSVDGAQQTWGSVAGPLAAGASIDIGTQGGSYAIPNGSHTIMAFADDVNRFAESNEGNNQLSQAITVGPAAIPTDLNGDGTTNVSDVQIGVNQALSIVACSSGDVNHDGTCNVVDVQQIVNKALGL